MLPLFTEKVEKGDGDDESAKMAEKDEAFEDAGEELNLEGVGLGLIKEEEKDSPHNTSTRITLM